MDERTRDATRKGNAMSTWGWLAVAAGGLVVLWLGYAMGPDAIRYLKIKNM